MNIRHTQLLQLFLGIPQHLTDGRIGIFEILCFNVSNKYPLGSTLKQCFVSLFRFSCRLFHPLALSDVHEGCLNRRFSPVLDRADEHFQPEHAPVRPHKTILVVRWYGLAGQAVREPLQEYRPLVRGQKRLYVFR